MFDSTTRRGGRLRAFGAVALLMVLVGDVASSAPGAGVPTPLTMEMHDSGAVARSHRNEQSCDDGGHGSSWRVDAEVALASGLVSSLPAQARGHLTVRSDAVDPAGGPPSGSGLTDPPIDPVAHLAAGHSGIAVVDERGMLRLALNSGSCDDPTLRFDGASAAGAATWSVERATGGYAGVTGSGSATIAVETRPGADNALHLDLEGGLSAPQPELEVEVLDSWWSNAVDYLAREVSVAVRVHNTGEGWAYGGLVDAWSPTAGVTQIDPTELPVGPLPPGGYVDVALRFQLGLLQPCSLVLLGCEFNAGATVAWTDALNNPAGDSDHAPATAPALPFS